MFTTGMAMTLRPGGYDEYKKAHDELSSKTQKEQGVHSLWTAPPSSWQSPFTDELPEGDLGQLVSKSGEARGEDDERLKAFLTPVTPEVLSLPTGD